MWQPRRPRKEFDNGDYELEDTKFEPPSRRKRVPLRVNPFIDAKTGLDKNASADGGTDDKNNDLDGFIVADDVEL